MKKITKMGLTLFIAIPTFCFAGDTQEGNSILQKVILDKTVEKTYVSNEQSFGTKIFTTIAETDKNKKFSLTPVVWADFYVASKCTNDLSSARSEDIHAMGIKKEFGELLMLKTQQKEDEYKKTYYEIKKKYCQKQ